MNSLPPYTLFGLQSKLEDSKYVVLPIPYDSTSSYIPGSRFAPHKIIEASREVELYDFETGFHLSDAKIHTLHELKPLRGDPLGMIKRIAEAVARIFADRKFPVILGGEHTVTIGAVGAAHTLFPDLWVVILDAHADLRDSFEGTMYSHACVTKRILDLTENVVLLGVRSLSLEEAELIEKTKIKISYSDSLKQDLRFRTLPISSEIGRKPVYLSIDVDVFNPAEAPCVSSPEPGGLSWDNVVQLLRELSKLNIIAFDIVEFTPCTDGGRTAILVSTLIKKLISYIESRSSQI
ncbi:MAG: agmatinase [Thermoproteota archaeon]|nr:MAG: agmatinase [Candidatus Korarchaeota archaeon]HDN01898.1 agmatinase [Candidatus Bathyarchaeota archaeon]